MWPLSVDLVPRKKMMRLPFSSAERSAVAAVVAVCMIFALVLCMLVEAAVVSTDVTSSTMFAADSGEPKTTYKTVI